MAIHIQVRVECEMCPAFDWAWLTTWKFGEKRSGADREIDARMEALKAKGWGIGFRNQFGGLKRIEACPDCLAKARALKHVRTEGKKSKKRKR